MIVIFTLFAKWRLTFTSAKSGGGRGEWEAQRLLAWQTGVCSFAAVVELGPAPNFCIGF